LRRRQVTVRVRLKPLLIAASLVAIVMSSLFIAQQMLMQPQPQLTLSEEGWLEWGEVAWRYFQPGVGVDANTGLNYGRSDWHRLTDWDLASYIEAIIAAEKLAILNADGEWGSNGRVEKVLRFLEARSLTAEKVSCLQYDAESGKVPEDMKNSSVHPSDWGRLLLALDDLRRLRPDLEKRIGSIVARHDNQLLGENKYFSSPDIYPFYAAQGYWAFGYSTPRLTDLASLGGGGTVDIYGLALPKARITSDPLLLAILEDRSSQIYRTYADRAYEAQKRRHGQTGTLTAYGEGAYPNPPYYAYEWVVTATGEQWTIQAGGMVKSPEVVYTKIAFAFHAVYSDDYTRKLVEETSRVASDKGFEEGISSDGTVLHVLSDKTNSMILEAAAYVRQRFEANLPKPGETPLKAMVRRHVCSSTELLMTESALEGTECAHQMHFTVKTLATEAKTDRFKV